MCECFAFRLVCASHLCKTTGLLKPILGGFFRARGRNLVLEIKQEGFESLNLEGLASPTVRICYNLDGRYYLLYAVSADCHCRVSAWILPIGELLLLFLNSHWLWLLHLPTQNLLEGPRGQ